MKINHTQKFLKNAAPVFVLKKKENLSKHLFFKELPKEDQRLLAKVSGEGDFTKTILLPSGQKALVIGVSPAAAGPSHRKLVLAARRIIDAARKEKIAKILINFEDFAIPAEVLATQFEIANFEFVQYKEKPKEGWFFVNEAHVYSRKNIQSELSRGKIIGEEINETRILANTPGGDMTPARLAEAAAKAGKRTGFKVRIFNENQIKKMKMGGVLGVARGSNEKPRFIIMEYLKGKKGERPVVLVGKGVTFDTGGLNVKPEDYMYEMHMDMSGGAAIIHTLAALARLKVKKNIIGLVPAVENMPSGSSYRPGDVLKTMSGKTIEVLNTDAEGRVILADALEYAKKYKPRLVIDVATLTGAAMAALGQRASAIFSTDSKISKTLQDTGYAVQDPVWPLPLWEEYEEEVKGTFADISNTGKTKYGGAITGAMFLWQFIKDHNWVHLDIAPRMTAIEGEFLAKGAAGAPVALLTNFFYNEQ